MLILEPLETLRDLRYFSTAGVGRRGRGGGREGWRGTVSGHPDGGALRGKLSRGIDRSVGVMGRHGRTGGGSKLEEEWDGRTYARRHDGPLRIK